MSDKNQSTTATTTTKVPTFDTKEEMNAGLPTGQQLADEISGFSDIAKTEPELVKEPWVAEIGIDPKTGEPFAQSESDEEPKELTYVPEGAESGDTLENFISEKPAKKSSGAKNSGAKTSGKSTTGKAEKPKTSAKQREAEKAKAKAAKELEKTKAKAAKEKAKADEAAKKLKEKEALEKTKEVPDLRGTTKENKAIVVQAQKMLAQSMATGSAMEVIMQLPNLSDEQVRGLYLKSTEAGKVMFIVQGAFAFEIYNRVKNDKKFLNRKGKGVNAVFNDLANEVGVDVATLYQDFRIFDVFGSYLIEMMEKSPEQLLPREYYQTAVKTKGHELEMLTYFEEQRQSVNYNVINARRDSALVNSGKTIEEVAKLDAEERSEAVKSGNKSPNDEKTASELTELPMLKLMLTKNPANSAWLSEIVEKYSSFEKWFTIRCTEEFGEVI